jgi:hypothetical protein
MFSKVSDMITVFASLSLIIVIIEVLVLENLLQVGLAAKRVTHK